MKQQGGKLFRYAFFLLITLAPGGQTGNLLRSLLTTKNGCLIFLFGFSFPKRYILQLLLRMGQVANSRIQLNIQFTRLQQLLLKRFEMSFGLLLLLHALFVFAAGDRQQFRRVCQFVDSLFLLSPADRNLLFDRADSLLKGLPLRFRTLDMLQILLRFGKTGT